MPTIQIKATPAARRKAEELIGWLGLNPEDHIREYEEKGDGRGRPRKIVEATAVGYWAALLYEKADPEEKRARYISDVGPDHPFQLASRLFDGFTEPIPEDAELTKEDTETFILTQSTEEEAIAHSEQSDPSAVDMNAQEKRAKEAKESHPANS